MSEITLKGILEELRFKLDDIYMDGDNGSMKEEDKIVIKEFISDKIKKVLEEVNPNECIRNCESRKINCCNLGIKIENKIKQILEVK